MIHPDIIQGQYEEITKKLTQICKVNSKGKFKLYEWYIHLDTGIYGNFFNGTKSVYYDISWEEINYPINYFKNKFN